MNTEPNYNFLYKDGKLYFIKPDGEQLEISESADVTEIINQINSEIEGLNLDITELKSQIQRLAITDTASGAIASFEDGADNFPVRDLVIGIDPVQDLHGYDNPWPGGGGANKFDEQMELGVIDASTGNNSGSTTQLRSVNYVPVVPSASYYALTQENTATIRFYDADKVYLGSEASTVASNSVFTVPANAYYMRFYLNASYGTTYNNDIAINYPSSVTTYTPYSNICPISGHTEGTVYVSETTDAEDGESYHSDFPSTVYGGTWDVVSGNLVADRAMYLVDGSVSVENVSRHSSGLYYTIVSTHMGSKETNPPVISNTFKSGTGVAIGNCYLTGYGSTLVVVLPDQSVTTKEQANQWFSDNPTQFVYELANPITYNLTSQEVRTLLGDNNVWADCGDVSVDYVADPKLYINKVISAL